MGVRENLQILASQSTSVFSQRSLELKFGFVTLTKNVELSVFSYFSFNLNFGSVAPKETSLWIGGNVKKSLFTSVAHT